jgi:hypothetical protein
VFKAARDADAGEFEQTLLGAKRQGQQDFLNFEGAKDAKSQRDLDFLRGIADDTSDSAVRFGDENNTLAGRENNALSQLLQVLAQSSSNRQGAIGPLMEALGKVPDFSGIGSAIGSLGKLAGSGQTSPFPSKNGDTINGPFWELMGKMGYLTPSDSFSSAFANDF